MGRRTLVAGMAALAAGVPSGRETRRRTAHEGLRWDELPANSAVSIAALMTETARPGCVTTGWLDAGAAEPPRDREES